MEFLPWGVLFLLATSAPLLGINPGRSSHSLLHTYMKESDQSLFILSTCLDGKRITRYDNKKHSVEVVLPRVQAFLQNDSKTNRREIDHAKDAEEYFGLALYHLNKLYNQSSETPEVELKAQERDGFKTLFCRAYGFEPVMIRMAWKKDGRDWQAHTFRGIVAPNVDGTYYFWISVRVGPEEEGCYVCRVEHASLAEPLERTWEESASVRQRFGTIVSLVVIAILSLVTTIYCKCFRQEKQTCPQSPVALSQELLDPRETLLGGETQGAQEDREGRPGDHQFCALCGKRYLSSIKKDRRGFSDKDFCSCPPVTLVEILSK
ncbi:major histocompatibility complex class I-related protein 1-like isoform X3 [Pogona vitticeps]